MHLKVITEPMEEPLGVEVVKSYLRLDHSEEDTLLKSMITVAREQAENFTRRSIASKTYELTLEEFQNKIKIPNPPLQTMESITVKDKSGTVTNVTNYMFSESEPAILHVEWPEVELYPVDAIKIRYTSGYDTVPKSLEQAMLLHVSHLYENREIVIVGTSAVKMPFSVESLLLPYKVGWF
ncbi:head-tail connector protein [Radiobacillus kanasensis]|uniref:head-tail connector protein n=1 Tax=Radiobacillus kanasensis TaxID=2844358 RepID=UPI001E38CF1E|nr:head-tail connector protein [Radiobacillus kanasensis]UFT98095.1 head-tail connector protein [Radiobacillus kanasensis]